MRSRRRARLVPGAVLAATLAALNAHAGERELDQDSPPSSVEEIETPIQRIFREDVDRPPVFPWFRQHLRKLPPFFADTTLEARFRTYWLRQDRADENLSEAWAMGGSVSYESGWLADTFAVEVEGFTSQPIIAPDSRDGTLLLESGQEGFSVLGIANGKLRYKNIVLTGYRQYLDLPYFNRQDNRMVPNTFEAVTLAKPEGELVFSTGYAWRVKLRDQDDFDSFPRALGIGATRGFAYAGAVWAPSESFTIGGVGGVIPDLFAGLYTETGLKGTIGDGLEARLDGQFTYQWEIGRDLVNPGLGLGLGIDVGDTWSLGLRASASYAGVVLRLGASVTGPNAPILSPFGTNPSYVDLMQRTFVLEDEKAFLASLSYDFSGVGLPGLTGIVNFVAAFDGRTLGVRRNAQEVDVTLDYRIGRGWLQSFWLRLRGSWLHEESRPQDGADFRVILRYDFPVI